MRENVETFINHILLVISNFDLDNRIHMAGYLQRSAGGQFILICKITGTRTIALEYTDHNLRHIFRHVVVEIVLLRYLWDCPAIYQKLRIGWFRKSVLSGQ